MLFEANETVRVENPESIIGVDLKPNIGTTEFELYIQLEGEVVAEIESESGTTEKHIPVMFTIPKTRIQDEIDVEISKFDYELDGEELTLNFELSVSGIN